MSVAQTCLGCQKPFVIPLAEKEKFETLIQTLPNFQMPKRCPACRRERRAQNPQPQRQASAPPQPASLAPLRGYDPVLMAPSAPQAPAAAAAPSKDEIRFVIANVDFENLVAGRHVTWCGVTLILADIGFKSMRETIDRVEHEQYDAKFNR